MSEKTPLDLPKKITSAYRLGELKQAAFIEMEACSEKRQYTPAKIQEWKELGLNRPEWIPADEWKMGDELSPRQVMICKSAALMMKADEISELTGMSPGYISSVLSSELGKQEIGKIQDQYFSNTKKMLEEILPLAVKTAFQVMLDPKTKPQVKADAAFRFMDRVMGRPVQQVEINDNLLRKVYETLDLNNVVDIKPQRIENAVLVEQTTEAIEDKPIDPADAWVKENL